MTTYSVVIWILFSLTSFSFFVEAPPTPDIHTLSLHDALPIWSPQGGPGLFFAPLFSQTPQRLLIVSGLRYTTVSAPPPIPPPDRKSTRLNSSHRTISYAVFCLKKKKKIKILLLIKSISNM